MAQGNHTPQSPKISHKPPAGGAVEIGGAGVTVTLRCKRIPQQFGDTKEDFPFENQPHQSTFQPKA